MIEVRDEVITMKSCGLICVSRSTAVSSNFQSGGSTVLLVFVVCLKTASKDVFNQRVERETVAVQPAQVLV